MRVIAATIDHFRYSGQFLGFNGSPGLNVSSESGSDVEGPQLVEQ
jgi:hypothetical protein